MKMRKILGAVLVGLMASLFSIGLAQAQGTKAINFQFTDIHGKSVTLSDFKGKWVLVNFWAPWCPLCWVEVPTLNELNKRKDFVVIGVGLDYGPDENVVRETAKRHNIEFHSVIAGGSRRNQDSPFRQVGPVDFYPTSYIYDPNGEIVMFIPGQVRMNKVLAFMEQYTAKNPTLLAVDKGVKAGVQATSQVAPLPPPVKEVTFTPPRTAEPKAPATGVKKPPVQRQNSSKTVTY
jgi:thiol-disulfide isomerase/thioredoxin